MVISKGKYKLRLNFFFFFLITRHYLNLLCIALDIKLWPGMPPFPETTPKNQEYMSVSSNYRGAGQGAAILQSDRESQAGVHNCPICTLMVLSADFHFVELLLMINRLCTGYSLGFFKLLKLLRATYTSGKNSICRDLAITFVG